MTRRGHLMQVGHMNHKTPVCRSWALTSFLVISLAAIASPSANAQGPTAFVNVSVIPMAEESVLVGYTVVVNGSEITAVGPSADVEVPHGAVVIEAEGKYLMPGLADMHAHLNLDPNPDFMRLFLAEGVTTIRNLNALPDHLEWRDQVLRGDRLALRFTPVGPLS